ALRWPAAAHAAHSRCGTAPCRARSPGHSRPAPPSCQESSTPAARPDAPASAGLARRPPDGGSRPARPRGRSAAQGGRRLRSRGSVASCAATPVAPHARQLRLAQRHLLRPGPRDLVRNRNPSYCELRSEPAYQARPGTGAGAGAGTTGEGVTAPGGPAHRGGSGAAGLWADAALGRGGAEGAEELVAEGAHWLERSEVPGQQPVLPVPGSNLPEHGRVVGDDRDRHLVVGPIAADGAGGLVVAEQNEHEVWVIELGDP